jgi:hypothetical protein
MSKKLSFLVVTLLVATFLVACGGSSNPTLESYLNENREDMMAQFAYPGAEITMEVGSGNELVFTIDISDQEYELWVEEAEQFDYESVAAMVYEDLVNYGPGWFVPWATEIRDETELDDVTITAIFRVGGDELARDSFESEE